MNCELRALTTIKKSVMRFEDKKCITVMVLLRRSVRKIQLVMANIKNPLWTEPLTKCFRTVSRLFED